MEKSRDEQTRSELKTQLVEQINTSLHLGDYSHALDVLQSAAAVFPNDAELAALEKLAHDGLKRNAEAQRLITESQELFALRKSAEAILLLRKAHELDKHNSLASVILANALVEQAQSIVGTDWLEAEKLANQALNLNPAHPTAKTVLNLIVEQKERSSVDDWVAQARKLQSSGDLFASLAWVAEGLAVHPHDPKLLQIQDEIQRDQEARRRQARRGDLEDLRRLQREIDAASDVAAKQALAERIQGIAAKHWTDGEILSIANALLLRLGLIAQEGSGASPRGKGATVILHVPRPSAPKPPSAPSDSVLPSPTLAEPAAASPVPTSSVPSSPVPQNPVSPTPTPPAPAPPSQSLPGPPPASTALPSSTPPSPVPGPPSVSDIPRIAAPPSKVAPSRVPLRSAPRGRVRLTPPEAKVAQPQSIPIPTPEPTVLAGKTPASSSPTKQAPKSNSTVLIVLAVAAMILVAAISYFAGERHAPTVANAPAAAPAAPASTVTAPAVSPSAQPNPEPSQVQPSTETAVATEAPSSQPLADAGAASTPSTIAESGRNMGTLLVVAGQDNARVFLNGKLQRELTHSGQLRLPNLPPRDYVVRVSKNGFSDPPQQAIRIRKGEEAKLIFNLQPPQPRLASLTIQGGAPGTAVFVDQAPVGMIQADGSLSVSSVNPGDHAVELRKDRFRPRQLKKHFVAGGAVSLTAAEAALEAASGELKITFAPTDAQVAIVKGESLTVVNSGVPLNLAPGTYTLTARTADRFTRSATLEVIAGQSKTLNLSLAANGMSKWDDPGAWKREGDAFTLKGGDFVLYSVVPASGVFVFSAMPAKGHLLQWVFNYTDTKNYVLFQLDDNTFYRAVIRNGEKTNEIRVPDKGDKKNLRMLHIRVGPTELVHQIKHGDSWTVVDRWTQPGVNLGQGKFGFYVPASDQITVSGFSHYADLNVH